MNDTADAVALGPPVKEKGRRNIFLAAALTIASVALMFLPSPSASSYGQGNSLRELGKIVEVDNAMVRKIGPIKEGEQQLRVRVLSGPFAGREFPSANHLIGKIELDKVFAVGDRAFLVLDLTEDKKDVAYANAIDHYRLDILAILAIVFLIGLLAFGGWIGAKAALSFVFTAAVIFKLLLPAMLLGWPPVPTSLALVAALTAAILFLVGGMNRKSLAAFLGSMGGALLTAILAEIVTSSLKLHGATKPFMEMLLYSGYGYLDLPKLFVAGVFIASSGAVLDMGMDIAAAMDEVARHNPGIGKAALLKSGLNVGRLVIGTQTTTLLLAYSSGYSGMLMTFLAQGIPTQNALNLVYVAAELAQILVGSFGLILVAPLTAIAGALLLSEGRRRPT